MTSGFLTSAVMAGKSIRQTSTSWPTERGFDKFYGPLSGGGSFWKPKSPVCNTTLIINKDLPKDYYTHAITENAVNFIKKHHADKPLFLYLAHYAPQRPLQAPERMKRYKAGYDVLRQQRFDRQKKLGVITGTTPFKSTARNMSASAQHGKHSTKKAKSLDPQDGHLRVHGRNHGRRSRRSHLKP